MTDPTMAGLYKSDSNPSLQPISNRTGSPRSITVSHVGGHHHALLKPCAQSQQIPDKDVPVPPVLTHDRLSTSDLDNDQSSIPRNLTPYPFRHTGTPVYPTEHIAPFPVNTGRNEVAGNETYPLSDSDPHFHTWRLPISKVRPAIGETEENQNLEVGDEPRSINKVRPENVCMVGDTFGHCDVDASKVRSFVDSSSTNKSNAHERIEKQQDYARHAGGSQGEISRASHASSHTSLDDLEHTNAAYKNGYSTSDSEASNDGHDDNDPLDHTESDPVDKLWGTHHRNVSACSLDGGMSDETPEFHRQHDPGKKSNPGISSSRGGLERVNGEKIRREPDQQREKQAMPSPSDAQGLRNVNLRNKSHISINEGQRFSLRRAARRQPTIARDWSLARKRFVAAVACSSTALIGVLVGIYAGLVPSIQYYIADFHHHTILGNVGLYLGMALPTLFCWPLPLLHGRKPYIVGSLCLAMPLLFPQALAVGGRRSPYTHVWRVALLLSRALMGFVLGFANMNFHSILTDLFGASLMSKYPHQETVDDYDVRRHGGGLGVWLGIWTWCFIGSLSVGFLIGAVVIEYVQPAWGLYISIILIAIVLFLNVLCPEVRRSAWRRSVAEVRIGETMSRRLARGEVMMHRVQTGPRWWGQEAYHGVALTLDMLRQPGFTIMAVYSAWIYAQVVLIIVLLGSLTSRSYRFRSPYVGAVVSSVAIGALAAIPFQKANLFSSARSTNTMSNAMTFDKKVTWSSRLIRRSVFTSVLPFVGMAYTLVSTGPPIHIIFPSLIAALVGFLSCLAISECNGLLMEAWDCSDLQPGMTGRSMSSKDSHKRTNYSSFPRVTAGWNFIISLGFIFAAGATALGGIVSRRLGQQEATGIVAGILFILTLLLSCTLIRFKRVQIIPECTCTEMAQWTKERRASFHNWATAVAAAKEKGTKTLNEIPEDDVG